MKKNLMLHFKSIWIIADETGKTGIINTCFSSVIILQYCY